MRSVGFSSVNPDMEEEEKEDFRHSNRSSYRPDNNVVFETRGAKDRRKNLEPGKDGEKADRVYYRIGIIDFLQEYNTAKYLELKIKKIVHPKTDKDRFSAQDPKKYARRFVNFLTKNMF